MSSAVECPECGRRLRVPEEKLGKTFHCPACQSPVRTKRPADGAQRSRPSQAKANATRFIVFGAVGAAAMVVTGITVFFLTRSAAAPDNAQNVAANEPGDLVPEAPLPPPDQQPQPEGQQDVPAKQPQADPPAQPPVAPAKPLKGMNEWEFVDFQKALDERNPAFVPAIEQFAQRKKGDDKNADELNALLLAANNLPDERVPGAGMAGGAVVRRRRASRGTGGVRIGRSRSSRQFSDDPRVLLNRPSFDPNGFKNSSMGDINRVRSANAMGRLKSLGRQRSSTPSRSSGIRRRR